MKIRQANSSDIPSIAPLFDDYRQFYGKESNLEGGKKFLTDRMNNNESVVFVAENNDNTLVGFIQLYPIFSSTRMKSLILLNDLFVNKNFRGQGISTQLMNQVKEYATKVGACEVILETEKSNTIGNSLYQKSGFIKNTDCNFYTWSTE